jgi:hypothetical protein
MVTFTAEILPQVAAKQFRNINVQRIYYNVQRILKKRTGSEFVSI